MILLVFLLLAQSPNELLRRGMERFQAGQVEESVRDFDQLARVDPAAAPHLWQRGIALYYLGRFKDCQAQFEQHRKVNPEDVENSAWHYLCTSRAESPVKARSILIPSTQDSRPPMLTVLSMYAGKASQDDVLREANKHDDTAKFFAYLYIGLYWEANGDRAKAAPWLQRAAEASQNQDYMGAVARVHWSRFSRK
jgi:lipoprotein NlpI